MFFPYFLTAISPGWKTLFAVAIALAVVFAFFEFRMMTSDTEARNLGAFLLHMCVIPGAITGTCAAAWRIYLRSHGRPWMVALIPTLLLFPATLFLMMKLSEWRPY
jgi:uncharacterized membrane protein